MTVLRGTVFESLVIVNICEMKYDVIVLGAGAAGLMAANDLLEAGYSVCLLEASAAAGGRMHTEIAKGFSQPVETGAEFVHGELPLTLALLNKAGIAYVPVEGKMITVRKKGWKTNEAHDKHWTEFMGQLAKLKTDVSIAEFLDQYFPGEQYAGLREAVRQYAEGFDLADIDKASAVAAQREWVEHDEEQYRIPGGYVQLVDFLLKGCADAKAEVVFNSCVNKIEYNAESVTVYTKNNKTFESSKLLITVSAGILQSEEIAFVPAPGAQYFDAIHKLGFGTVIKILMEFKTPFWENYAADIGFLLSDEMIPTWWTQLPTETNLLTGWMGGPRAAANSNETKDSLLHEALNSLSAIFHISILELEQQLTHHSIHAWHNNPYVKGGYSYVTIDSAKARKILSLPINEKIYFAGEAMYGGESQGTVEAALQSGKEMAKKIMEDFSAHKQG
ncbi:MAG: NAD(P)/FAD-dependent oxidoreductase [Bacteroidota bacterium]